MTNRSEFGPRPWMRSVLLLAAVYNIAWGAVVVLFPDTTLAWAGLQTPVDYPQIWQCVGMIVGVYGIGYAIAARDPFRHWPIILVGGLGKILGPIGFLFGYVGGELPAAMAWTILLNDLIWWTPFGATLWAAFRYHQIVGYQYSEDIFGSDPILDLVSREGENLYELTRSRPQLVLFLRHSGCTFCRQALADLAEQREAIQEQGYGIVLVHLGNEEEMAASFRRHGLNDLPQISDPQCRLYRQFGLQIGAFGQLFGLQAWWQGLRAGLIEGHGIGAIGGNALQMPGVFVISRGRILKGFQHRSAADRPVYLGLVKAAMEEPPISVNEPVLNPCQANRQLF